MEWKAETIEGHAMLSDCETAALVYEDGTIDWLCLPRFDSPACMAALLGDAENGGWWLRPAGKVLSQQRRYRGETMVLETVYRTSDGEVAVLDFMPVRRGVAPDIVRIIEGRSGRVDLTSRLALRFDDGRTHPLVTNGTDGETIAIAGPNGVVLRFDTDIGHRPRCFESMFSIKAGERKALVMSWFDSAGPVPGAIKVDEALAETMEFWTQWSRKSAYQGIAATQVRRSLITLRGLFNETSGAIIAAATSSLPEKPGSTCNWDYRYCWLRDATFTLLAFMGTGHKEEARRWVDWLHRALAGDPIQIQPFYRIDGSRQLLEWEADWLGGFRGAKPVRFGNLAVSQLQLDIYGEVIDTLFVASRTGVVDDAHELVFRLARDLETRWYMPDAGIWESRAKPQHHVYSKAMCWVAFDRAARMMEVHGTDRTTARRWHNLAEHIRHQVLRDGFNDHIGALTQCCGTARLDGAVLRLPLVGFIDAQDERMIATVAAFERRMVDGGYVYRLSPEHNSDTKGFREGAFLAVGCWLADVYVLQGRAADARRIFDTLLAAENDLGLLSEEYSVEERRALGNFPQALSHIALVNTAMTLSSGKPPRLVV